MSFNLILFLAIFCLVYALIMFFSAFMKARIMIKIVKIGFGKNLTDKKACNIMYISGVGLLIASIVLFIVN